MPPSPSQWIVANFKLNGSEAFFRMFINELINAWQREERPSTTQFVLCPPFPYLLTVAQGLQQAASPKIHLGAQDCGSHDAGAFTGEVSAAMLKDVGCSFVLLGHSERRLHQGETDAILPPKIRMAYEAGLCPIICVGESAKVRKAGKAVDFVVAQLKTCLENHPPRRTPFFLAYEPLWSIGTDCIPTMEEISEMHQALKEALQAEGILDSVLLYGGSVTPENAAEILACKGVGGVLVGRPSLNVKTLLALIK